MRSTTLLAFVASLALASGCSSGGSTAASQPADSSSQPVKVMSCDEELTFTKPPSRVVMMGDTGASIMSKLGVLDKVTGRAGKKNFEPYDEATRSAIEAIPELKSSELETGGAKIATEVLLEARPDLVVGYDEGVDRAALRKAGIPVYSPDAFCKNHPVKKAGFDLVNQEITKFGDIFAVKDKADALIKEVDAQTTKLKEKPATGTAAALYITPGTTTFYTYGTSSMVQPIFEVNGLKNRYDDKTERVFDASMEELLARNPDWIVLLYAEGTEQQAQQTFAGFKGVDQLKAVKAKQVVAIPFSLTDPPSLLSVEGAVELGKKLHS